MKKDLRKILAALMALAMVCGAPLAMNSTSLGTAVSVGAEPLEDTSADIQQEASSEFMKYVRRSSGFDVQGLNTEGNDIQTTFGDAGFYTYLQVGGNEKARAFGSSFMFGKVETIQGVELSITPSFTSNGKGVYITYSLYNGNEEAVDVKLGSCGDTTINGNDRNTVELTDGGVKMYSGDVTMYLIPGNANFTTTWVGRYWYEGIYYIDYVFENGIGPGYSDGQDSAMCWSWSLHLEPGENKLLTAVISVSEEAVATYECTLDPANGEDVISTRVMDGEAAMKPNDPKKEDSRFKFWSADGTTEYNFDTVLTGDISLTAVYDDLTKTEAVQPGCENDGSIAYWTAEDGTIYSDAYGTRQITAEETLIPATGHEWGEPSFEWSADYSECTVRIVCTIDESHIYEETVKSTADVTKAPTTEEWGETVYTAVFEADVESQTAAVETPPIEIPHEEEGAAAPTFNVPRIGTGGVGTPEARAEENYTWSAKLDGGTIYWESQPGADKYIISARRKGDTQWKRVGTTQDTEFDLSSMEKGTYTFLVRYVKGDFTAPARLSARTEAAVGSAKPVATAVSDEAGYVVLKWNAADGAKKYRVYRVQDGKLKKLGETAKCAVRVRGTSGDKFAVKAYINGKWTKVSKADLVTVK